MLVKKIAEYVSQMVEGLEIVDYCVCFSGVYVVVKGPRGKALGFAHIPREDLHELGEVRPPALEEMADFVVDLHTINRALGVAMVNAVSQYHLGPVEPGDLMKYYARDPVCLIGNMRPLAEALKKRGHLRDRFLEELSGGEFRLILLARAPAVEPRVLLLDEPFNNLNLRHQLEVASLLRKLSSDVTVMAVLHDLNMALRYADYAIFMSRGEVYAAGPTKAVFREDVIYDVYGVKTKILWETPAAVPQ